MLVIVSDIEAARDELVRLGVKVSEVYHYAGVNRIAPDARRSGPAPDRSSSYMLAEQAGTMRPT
jgi:hypothetical protein